MEHTFYIYYSNSKFDLESIVIAFGKLNYPMNRAGISTGANNEITSFRFDPFNGEFNGLQLTFLFTNSDKKWNKLIPDNINDLKTEVEYEQVCYLHFNDIEPWQLTTEQINQVELIFNAIGDSENTLVYSNGHQYFYLENDRISTDKKGLLNLINIEWNK